MMNNIKDSKIGKGSVIWNFTSIINSRIGRNCNIGNNCEIYKAIIGNDCKVGFGCFICEGVIIEDDCFVSPRVCFSNDKYPSIKNIKGGKFKLLKTIVKRGASIGINATILPGIIIGENSLVGAGSVVTKNVKPNTVVIGNPAKILIRRNKK